MSGVTGCVAISRATSKRENNGSVVHQDSIDTFLASTGTTSAATVVPTPSGPKRQKRNLFPPCSIGITFLGAAVLNSSSPSMLATFALETVFVKVQDREPLRTSEVRAPVIGHVAEAPRKMQIPPPLLGNTIPRSHAVLSMPAESRISSEIRTVNILSSEVFLVIRSPLLRRDRG